MHPSAHGAWHRLQRVAPGFAHRMVNTGSRPLVSFYVFRADAGHDYAAIEASGFRCAASWPTNMRARA